MAERDATYFARERGGAVPEEPDDDEEGAFGGEGYEGVATAVMTAAVQRRPTTMILNVPNRGAIGGLADDDVVEVTCLADEHGAHPLAQGTLPEPALELIRQVKLYERLTVQAAVEGSRDAALAALLAHPLVGSYPAATAILEGYEEELRGLLPTLA
jgi:6-phospho-beta-glucosidase